MSFKDTEGVHQVRNSLQTGRIAHQGHQRRGLFVHARVAANGSFDAGAVGSGDLRRARTLDRHELGIEALFTKNPPSAAMKTGAAPSTGSTPNVIRCFSTGFELPDSPASEPQDARPAIANSITRSRLLRHNQPGAERNDPHSSDHAEADRDCVQLLDRRLPADEHRHHSSRRTDAPPSSYAISGFATVTRKWKFRSPAPRTWTIHRSSPDRKILRPRCFAGFFGA
jgi:hypothetical protein